MTCSCRMRAASRLFCCLRALLSVSREATSALNSSDCDASSEGGRWGRARKERPAGAVAKSVARQHRAAAERQ